MRRALAAAGALALVVASCGKGAPSPTATSPAPVSTQLAPPEPASWAAQAASYAGEYVEAFGSGSFDALAWLSPESSFQVAGYPTTSGYESALAWLREQARAAAAGDVTWVPRHVFLGTDGASVAVELRSDPGGIGQWMLVDLGIGEDGITTHEERPLGSSAYGSVLPDAALYARTVADVDAGWATAASAAAVEAVGWLYDHYPAFAAFAADSPGLEGLAYTTDARSVDGLRALDVPGGSGVWPAGWRLRPAVLAEDAPFPALATDSPHPTDDGGVVRAAVPSAEGWFEVDTGDGCPRLALVSWQLVGGYPEPPRIAAESIRWDAASLDRCGMPGGGAAPAGWWTTVPEPSPPEDRVVATASLPDGAAVGLANVDTALADLVRWGFERFVEAGIGVPHPHRVAFEPARLCEAAPEASGQVDTTAEGYVATICFSTEEAGSDVAQWFLLHELGHVWSYEHLDVAARRRFVEAAGLPAWDGASIPYADRGIEAAANVIAWALLGGQPRLTDRLDRWTCDEVVELYRLLAGVPPLSTCASDPGT